MSWKFRFVCWRIAVLQEEAEVKSLTLKGRELTYEAKPPNGCFLHGKEESDLSPRQSHFSKKCCHCRHLEMLSAKGLSSVNFVGSVT